MFLHSSNLVTSTNLFKPVVKCKHVCSSLNLDKCFSINTSVLLSTKLLGAIRCTATLSYFQHSLLNVAKLLWFIKKISTLCFFVFNEIGGKWLYLLIQISNVCMKVIA